jgi:hypothetical protein
MYLPYLSRTPTDIAIMSDAEIEHKREEDERLDTAEDPNEEVRQDPETAYRRTSPETVHTTHPAHKKNVS